jgi:hypothetical protein
MGFRSNFIAEVSGYSIPEWFKEKYPNWIFHGNTGLQNCFAQLFETKFYEKLTEDERFLDVQKMLKEQDWGGDEIIIILLHECGGITRVSIKRDLITAQEPTDWSQVENVEHDYCYGCSDAHPLSTNKE